MKVYQSAQINCIFVCSGDFRQILPVVKYGNANDVIEALITSSDLWSKFNIYQLTQNMRLTALQTALSDEATDLERDNYVIYLVN